MSASRAKALFFFFNDTATTEIYTLSLHDALPIWISETSQMRWESPLPNSHWPPLKPLGAYRAAGFQDRKSTRLNSSHANISYAVFCLKKKRYDWAGNHHPRRPFTVSRVIRSSDPA